MCDPAKFKVGANRATEMLYFQQLASYSGTKYRAIYLAEGHEALQEVAPEGWQPERLMGGFSAAWRQKLSGNMPVLQYVGGR